MIHLSKKQLTTILYVLFAPLLSLSQGVISKTDGTVLRSNPYSEVSGIPFFSGNDWVKGKITTDDQEIIENIDIKYDLVKDLIYISDDEGNLIKPSKKIIQFSLPDNNGLVSSFESGFPACDKLNERSYYQILHSTGNLKLLKHSQKIINETLSYGSTLKEYSLISQISYYLYDEATMENVSTKKIFSNSKFSENKRMKEFLKDSKIDFKNEEDLIKLANYIQKVTSK